MTERSLGWATCAPGPPKGGDIPRQFFLSGWIMANKILSVFIDESGDFGKYDPKSPYYYVSMVLHDQSVDISSEIDRLEQRVTNFGFPHHAIHVGPIIRREKQYENDEYLIILRQEIAKLKNDNKEEERQNLIKVYESHPIVNNYYFLLDEVNNFLFEIKNALE